MVVGGLIARIPAHPRVTAALLSITQLFGISGIHRWLAIAFTVTVIANFVALGQEEPPAWVVYSPLLPLFLLQFTGLYMFVLPYATTWHSGRRTGAME